MFSRVQKRIPNKSYLVSIFNVNKHTYSVSYTAIMMGLFFFKKKKKENLPVLTYLTSLKCQLSLHMSLDFLKEKL